MKLKTNMRTLLMRIVAVSAIALAGCSTTDVKALVSQGNAVSTTSTHLPATHPNRVKIYYSNIGLPKQYKIVGRVSVENYNMLGMEHSQASIAEELRKQAASIGANGVMNVYSGLTQTIGDAIISK
jgi:hypothetical protein